MVRWYEGHENQVKRCAVELKVNDWHMSAWPRGLWYCKKSARYGEWPACNALKVKKASLNLIRHSVGSQWSCLRSSVDVSEDKKAVMSQGEQRDAAINFDTYRI